jgi:phosphomannomutase/phosphoglucomutase
MHYSIETSPAHIFRAYDIRGKVGSDLNADRVYTIGRAYATLAMSAVQQVVIARDGRLSGPELLDALQQGLLDGGLNIINIGAAPTPVCTFAAEYFKTYSSIMLTGSHNPKEYNGLKMSLAGETLFDQHIQDLYQISLGEMPLADKPGTVETHNILQTYIDAITNHIQLKRPLKIAIDCGNGIAGAIAPDLYKALGCEVIPLFSEVDGNFPNHHPDPSKLDNLQDLIASVKKEDCDVGLAFDGDGDRLGVVTSSGEVIWPDRQMILFARDVLAQRPGSKIIYDVKCTQTLPLAIKEAGGQPVICKTGHSFVKNAIKREGASLAGEMSGHIFFNDLWYGFDDALYSGARLLNILAAHDNPLGLFQALPNTVNTPEINIAVEEHEKFNIIQTFIENADFPEGEINTLDGIRVDFKDGFGLIRASNTTPNLVLRFEGHTQDSLERIRGLFYNVLDRIIG